MDEPPFLIDGARVLAYAALPPPDASRSHVVADGVPLGSATAAAVTENLADAAVFLLYCNADWETLVAEQHDTRADAQQAALAQFPALEWQDYRPLTESEAAQVETTREFLRDLSRDFPGGL